MHKLRSRLTYWLVYHIVISGILWAMRWKRDNKLHLSLANFSINFLLIFVWLLKGGKNMDLFWRVEYYLLLSEQRKLVVGFSDFWKSLDHFQHIKFKNCKEIGSAEVFSMFWNAVLKTLIVWLAFDLIHFVVDSFLLFSRKLKGRMW